MLITATTAILFLVVAIACVVAGHYTKHLELYAFGLLVIFLFSGFVWYNGISEQTGQVVSTDNSTGVATTVYSYTQNRELWVDFLSLGSMLLGVFLALNLYTEYSTEKQRRREEELDAT